MFALVVACNVVLKGVRDILVIAADDDLVLFSSNFIVGVAVTEKLLPGKAVVVGAADTVTVVVDLVNVLTVDERIAVVSIVTVVTCVNIDSGIIIISAVVVVDIVVVFNLDEFLVAEVADSGCFVILTPAFVARFVFVIDGDLVVESALFIFDCIVLSGVVLVLVVVIRHFFVASLSVVVAIVVTGAGNVASTFVIVADEELVVDSVVPVVACVVGGATIIATSSSVVALDGATDGNVVTGECIVNSVVVIGTVTVALVAIVIGGVEGVIVVFSGVPVFFSFSVTCLTVISVLVAGDLIIVS